MKWVQQLNTNFYFILNNMKNILYIYKNKYLKLINV